MASGNSSVARRETTGLAPADIKAIQQLKQAVARGEHWYRALLKAVKLWNSTEEDYEGRHYQYLIDNEAFDWLLLAERLCKEISPLIPPEEQINLLFFDQPPLELSKDEFKELIGSAKYQAYLNYLYGVFMERFLILTTVEEIRKRKRTSGVTAEGNSTDEAYHYLYGESEEELARRFRKEKRYPRRRSMNLSELNQFAYWLFKRRLLRSDKSRLASDTKKALLALHQRLEQKNKLNPRASGKVGKAPPQCDSACP